MTGTPKALREYTLQGQTATAGLNGCWKVYAAKAKKEGTAHPHASIWILDKRAMAETGVSPAEVDAAAETARRDASALARLKHPAIVKVSLCSCQACMQLYPALQHNELRAAIIRQTAASKLPRAYGMHACHACIINDRWFRDAPTASVQGHWNAVLQVIEGLEETRSQLLLVTEPIFASAADLLAKFGTLPPAAAAAREGTRLSELEIKAGLLQVVPHLRSCPVRAPQSLPALWAPVIAYLTYCSNCSSWALDMPLVKRCASMLSGMLLHLDVTMGGVDSSLSGLCLLLNAEGLLALGGVMNTGRTIGVPE